MACVNDKYFTDPTVRCVARGVVYGACNYRQLRPAWEWEHLIGGLLVEEAFRLASFIAHAHVIYL
jgi:hypothetical protein